MTIRILNVIDGLGTGGAERSLAEMVPALVEADIEPTVACFYRRPGVGEALEAAGVDIRVLEGARPWQRARWLRGLIRQDRPDLVHTTLLRANLTGRIAATRTGVPVLTSLVNTPYEPVRLVDPNLRRGSLRAVRAVDGWTARHLTSHFHAITHSVRDAAVRDLGVPADQITVIERGRDPERLGQPTAARRDRARRDLGLSDGDEVLVTVGRQEYQKGQRHLLDAVARLVATRPRLVVLVAGREGHATSELLAQREALGLIDRVQFLGFRADTPEVLAAADLFVFPSLYEGLGGSVIEAMALGLPVVASDIPALREVLEADQNAVLTPAGDAVALAASVDQLLDDPGRRSTFAARSRAIFEERFTLEQSTRRMIGLYRQVADGGPVRPPA